MTKPADVGGDAAGGALFDGAGERVRNGFFQVQHAFVDRYMSELTPIQFKVLFTLASYAGMAPERVAWCGMDAVARAIGNKETKHARRAVGELAVMGFVRRVAESQGGRGCTAGWEVDTNPAPDRFRMGQAMLRGSRINWSPPTDAERATIEAIYRGELPAQWTRQHVPKPGRNSPGNRVEIRPKTGSKFARKPGRNSPAYKEVEEAKEETAAKRVGVGMQSAVMPASGGAAADIGPSASPPAAAPPDVAEEVRREFRNEISLAFAEGLLTKLAPEQISRLARAYRVRDPARIGNPEGLIAHMLKHGFSPPPPLRPTQYEQVSAAAKTGFDPPQSPDQTGGGEIAQTDAYSVIENDRKLIRQRYAAMVDPEAQRLIEQGAGAIASPDFEKESSGAQLESRRQLEAMHADSMAASPRLGVAVAADRDATGGR